MELPFPKEIGVEFGIRRFALSDQAYLHPGKLFDLMAQDRDISLTGAFVGRLVDGPTPEDTAQNINAISSLLMEDPVNEATKERVFCPGLLKRLNIWPEKNAFLIVSAGEDDRRTKDFKKLRTGYMKQLQKWLESREKTELEHGLEAGGVDSCLNVLFKMLRGQQKIMYGAGISMPEHLNTTETTRMVDMESHISHLPGGIHAGINVPVAYVGSEGSTFNAHIEDRAFESINRHVAGAPKIWFIVPPRYHKAFLELAQKLGVRSQETMCKAYLQHKFFFIDPRTVINEGIPVFTIIQRPGDVVYLLPNTIHLGFNCGINVTEAVNCASSSWAFPGMLDPGRCCCPSVEGLYYNLRIEPMLRAIGIKEATVRDYQKCRLADISRGLLTERHPETGRPFDCNIQLKNLLGMDFEDHEVGKPFTSSLPEGYVAPEQFYGGIEEVNVEDSDDDETEEEVDAAERFKCPVSHCSYNAGHRRGAATKRRLENHVRKMHDDVADETIELIQERENKRVRQVKSEPDFTCASCNKELRGNMAHQRRHEESCLRASAKKGKH